MIDSIQLKSLRKEELLSFLRDVVKHCENFDLAALMLQLSVKELRSILTELESVLKTEQGSKLTKEIEQIDHNRDCALTGISKVCEGYTYSDIPEIANAATLISNSIASYDGSITGMNYVAETSIVNDLGYIWTNERNYVEALEKLRLTKWAKKLIVLNKKFNNKQIERDQEYGVNNKKSFTEIRPLTYQAYQQLCNHIFAYSIANKGQKEQYTSLEANVNTLIERYNSIIEKRAYTPYTSSEKEVAI